MRDEAITVKKLQNKTLDMNNDKSILILQIQIVKMDFKRSLPSPSILPQQSRNQPLAQPLIGISKASTPIRSRLVAGNLNGTPVSMKKFVKMNTKSPGRNKENSEINLSQLDNSKQIELESSINLSPILALNRRMQEGYKANFLSFASSQQTSQKQAPATPNGRNQTSHSHLFEKNYQTVNSVSNHGLLSSKAGHMKSSSSFKGLLQSREKTSSKKDLGSFVRNSSAHQIAIQDSVANQKNQLQFGQEGLSKQASKSKLGESRSIQKMLMSPRAQAWELKCSNEDGKKAKYQLILQEKDEDSERYYCSKCTISLVQQGFSVEQLTPEKIEELTKQPRGSQLTDQSTSHLLRPPISSPSSKVDPEIVKAKQKMAQRYGAAKEKICQLSEELQSRVEDIDCYYNSIIQYLSQRKNTDKASVASFRAENLQGLERYLKQLERATKFLSNLAMNGKSFQVKKQLQELEKTLIQPQEPGFQVPKCNIQASVDEFADRFERVLCPPFQPVEITNTNQAMRFSFEMALSQTHKVKSNAFPVQVNPLIEEEEEDEADTEELSMKDGKKPFRTLFPEEQEGEQDHHAGINSPTFKQF